MHEVSPPYTPQLKGVAERKNSRIMEMVSCMMIFSWVPMRLWAEAACCVVYLVNQTNTKAIETKVPKEIWSISI